MPTRRRAARWTAAGLAATALAVVALLLTSTSTSPPSAPTPTSPSAPRPPARAATCAAEVVPPKPGGGRWQCSFDDEFDSHSGDAQALNTAWWTPQTTSTSGYNTGTAGDALACYVDTPETIAVSGGALRLRVEKLAEPVQCGTFSTQYVAGMVTTVNGFSQTYGRFEVRARIPRTSVPGLQETLWLWPKNSARYGSAWPDSGEVDFAEFFSSKADLDVPNIHYNYDPATIDATTHTNLVTAYCPIDPARYNDYAVVWSPGNFTITVDGNICLIDNYTPDQGLTTPQPFDQPFFIALTQALGVGGNAFDPARTPLPATTSIDYVRAWN